jgi:hypothetical protein
VTEEEKDIYGRAIKKIIFKDTAQRHVELKTKLQYDGMTQSKFFKMCVTAYLQDEENMRDMIEAVRKKKSFDKKIQKDIKEAKKNKKDFNLDEMELENIFDAIESSHPDL